MRTKGQSLFEVVFALAISALIIITIVSLANKSLGNTNNSTDRALATRYAQQMTECLREKRDTSWDEFVTLANTSCNSFTLPSQFTSKTITFTCSPSNCSSPNSVDTVTADIEITWQDGTGKHQVRSITRFTEWRAR